MTSASHIQWRVRALLFDMDGTLVDSTAVVERTWGRFARRHQLELADILVQSHGRRTGETVQYFAPPGVDIKQEIARVVAEEVADVEGIVAVPGAAALLASLPRQAWAVVTSANRELAERRMSAAGLPLPEVMIAAEDVRQGKPAPEGYLAAAQRLGVAPADCLVLEDAPAGLQAARVAGMRVLAIASHLDPSVLAVEDWIEDFLALSVAASNEPTLTVTRTVAAHG